MLSGLEAYRWIGTKDVGSSVWLFCLAIRDIVNLIAEVRVVEMDLVRIDT